MFSSRMVVWLYVSVGLFLLALAFAPQQFLVFPAKLALATTAGWIGYHLYNSLFPYARPHHFLVTPWSPGAPGLGTPRVDKELQIAWAAAVLSRALIVFGAMLAVSLGA